MDANYFLYTRKEAVIKGIWHAICSKMLKLLKKKKKKLLIVLKLTYHATLHCWKCCLPSISSQWALIFSGWNNHCRGCTTAGTFWFRVVFISLKHLCKDLVINWGEEPPDITRSALTKPSPLLSFTSVRVVVLHLELTHTNTHTQLRNNVWLKECENFTTERKNREY